jgi:hypothetical protein
VMLRLPVYERRATDYQFDWPSHSELIWCNFTQCSAPAKRNALTKGANGFETTGRGNGQKAPAPASGTFSFVTPKGGRDRNF